MLSIGKELLKCIMKGDILVCYIAAYVENI